MLPPVPSSSGSSSSSLVTPPYHLLQVPLLHLLSLHPFAAVHSSALPLLTDVLHNYIALLSTIASRSASHAGRTSANPWDVAACLDQVGPIQDLWDLERWINSEERREWSDRMEGGFGTGLSGLRAKEDWQRHKESLKQAVRTGTTSAVVQGKMMWMSVDEDDLATYRELQALTESRPLKRCHIHRGKSELSGSTSSPKRTRRSGSHPSQSSEGGVHTRVRNGTDGHSLDADDASTSADDDSDGGYYGEYDEDDVSAATDRTSASPPRTLLRSDEELYKERSLPLHEVLGGQCREIHYVPSFLPPFPEIRRKEDVISEAPIKPEILTANKSNRQPINPSESADNVDLSKVEHGAEGLEISASTPTSYFTEPIPFASSSLFKSDESGSNASLPAASSFPSLPHTGVRQKEPASSRPAFIEAYTSLTSSGEGPALLPQTIHRRQMALHLSQPSLYAPTDTLYGGIGARPSAIPFTPSASLLITLPANGGAPRFTPTRPKGRPLQLASSSGVSTPILEYRKPAHTLSRLARSLLANAPVVSVPRPEGTNVASQSGTSDLDATITALNPEGLYAPPLSILHRSLHIMDPPPLRDEGYVERVFRGAALSAEDPALTRGESWLKASLDAVEVASGEKVKSGTLVYTWDWVSRDWTREEAI